MLPAPPSAAALIVFARSGKLMVAESERCARLEFELMTVILSP